MVDVLLVFCVVVRGAWMTGRSAPGPGHRIIYAHCLYCSCVPRAGHVACLFAGGFSFVLGVCCCARCMNDEERTQRFCCVHTVFSFRATT